MKREILKLSIVTTLLLLVGCGGGSGSTTKDNNNSSTQPEAQDENQRLIGLGLTPPLSSGEVLSNDITKVNNTIDITDPNLDLKAPEINSTLFNSGIFIQQSNISLIQPELIIRPKLEPFNLLVISDNSLTDVLNPLKIHKDKIGIKTEIFSWQTLVTDFQEQGRDDPERIKKAIAYYNKNFGVKYVMIVGDIDNFPSRFCKNYDNHKWGDGWTPTDLYYADLYKEGGAFDEWDDNKNNLFCETKATEEHPNGGLINVDKIDGYADIALGRVPANTAQEVQNYVDKIIQYENAPVQEWQKKALMIVPAVVGTPTKEEQDDNIYFVLKDAYHNGSEVNGVSTHLKTKISDILKKANISSIQLFHGRYPDPNQEELYPKSSNIVKYINSGVGFVNFAGHGGYGAWDMGQKISMENRALFTNSTIKGLNNIDKLPVVVSIACDTGKYYFASKYTDINGNEFDAKKDCTKKNNEVYCQPSPYATNNTFAPQPKAIQPSTHNIDSMAENFLVNTDKTGAIAFVASTEAAQGNINSDGNTVGSFAIDKEFANSYALIMSFQKLLGGEVRLGNIWKLTNYNYIRGYVDMKAKESNNWTKTIPFSHLLKYHLFGDPSLVLKNSI